MSKDADQNKNAPKDQPKQGGPKDGDKAAKKGGPPGGPAGGKKPQQPKKHEAEPEVPAGPKVPPRLRVLFEEQVRSKVADKFKLTNRFAQPKLEKIVVNVNMGRHLEGSKIPPHVRGQVIETVTKITGQKPVVVKARKSVSNFKLRAGFEASAMVTMRRERMWHFLDRLINL